MSGNISLERQCTLQAKLFIAARRDRGLVEDLAKILCASGGLREDPAAHLLASAVIGFISANGVDGELSMETFDYTLSLADESLAESALDSMFRQVEKGERYDTFKHKWVDDPCREAHPDADYVAAYRKFKADKAVDRIRTARLLRMACARIGEYPGWDYLGAALLEGRAEGGGCPIRGNCDCYSAFMFRLSRAMSTALKDCPPADSGQLEAYVSNALNCLRQEARVSAARGERMRVEECAVPEGAASLSKKVAGRPLRYLRTPFCPEAGADLALVKRLLGLDAS